MRSHPEWSREWDKKNPEKRKLINFRNELRPERKQYHKDWNDEHPRSFTGYPIDTRNAMNEKRIIQDNTCQWAGCGITWREVPIHVHHILPKSEFPQYQAELWNLICYCGLHHLRFHVTRGDPCVPLLKAQVMKELGFDIPPPVTKPLITIPPIMMR